MSKPIGSLLTNVIPAEHLWKLKIFGCWKSIIGNLQNKVRIEKISDTSITLGVTHATWAHELFLISPMIKNKINEALKEEKIKSIHFRIVPFGQKNSKSKKTERITILEEHNLSIIEHSHLEKLKNKDLANILAQFYIRCKNQKARPRLDKTTP
jgi:hypothetical protein